MQGRTQPGDQHRPDTHSHSGGPGPELLRIASFIIAHSIAALRTFLLWDAKNRRYPHPPERRHSPMVTLTEPCLGGAVVCLEPLAEVERALLVVEVLHAEHPEAGGLLLGLGEHAAQTQSLWSATSQDTNSRHTRHTTAAAPSTFPALLVISPCPTTASARCSLNNRCPPPKRCPDSAPSFHNYPRQGGRPPAPAHTNRSYTPANFQHNKKNLGQGGGGRRVRAQGRGGIEPA